MGSPWCLVSRPLYRALLRLIGLLFSWNHGQTCCAGTRIFVQSGIYDKFLASFTERIKAIKVGDPFTKGVHQGPQVSKLQYDVRLPSLPFSVTKITVCDLFSASCRTSILARSKVPSSTLVVAVLVTRVTSSRCVHCSFSRSASHRGSPTI